MPHGALPPDVTLHTMPLLAPVRFARSAIQAWMCETLAATSGVDPAALHFAEDPYGKPYLTDSRAAVCTPSFNLSHSGNWAVLAVSARGRAVGVDIEIPRPGRDLRRLVDGFLSPVEQADLAHVPPEHMQIWLLRRWSAKEALAKAWGLGLTAGLARIAIADAEPATWRTCSGLQPPQGQWRLAELKVPEGVGWVAWDDALQCP